jgi:broad specificity phosphatase PhoE
MRRLSLLCHGATAATRAAAFPLDEPLEPRARAAARTLATRLPTAPVLTSPTLRARQTADALARPARVDPALRDCDYGRWAGLGVQAVGEREPEAFAAFITDPAARPHGGESVADLHARAAAWLADRLEGRGHLLAVTHAAFVRAALLAALSAPLEGFWRIDIPPLATAELVSDGRRWNWRAARAPVPR